MSKKANPTVIGAFVLGALAISVVAVLLLAGGDLFQRKIRIVMYFKESVQGLAVGAPVVFRGIQVGTVTNIHLHTGEDANARDTTIAVEAEGHPESLRASGQAAGLIGQAGRLPVLVKQGLRAQLQAQSLLTGQLYIMLDFLPGKVEARVASVDSDAIEIPTVLTPLKRLTAELEEFPIQEVLADLRASIAGINKLVNSPQTGAIMGNANAAMETYTRLAREVDAELNVLTLSTRQTLAAADTTLKKSDAVMDNLQQMSRADSPLNTGVNDATRQIADAARAMRELAADNSNVVVDLNQATKELSTAARATRNLADALERQPQSLIWGRQSGDQ